MMIIDDSYWINQANQSDDDKTQINQWSNIESGLSCYQWSPKMNFISVVIVVDHGGDVINYGDN